MIPKISVVMSVFNGDKYLHEAIDSILEQSFGDFEFIIVDDGSTDRSAEMIRSYNDKRIMLIQQANKGLSAALNVGLKVARGRYIARIDADDISLGNRFEVQYEFLERHPDCVVLGSNAIVIDAEGEYLFTSNQPTEWQRIRRNLPGTPFYHSSTVFRTDAAMKCGGYYEGVRHYFEDIIFFNRLSEFGELRNLAEPLIKYRLVPSAITNQDSKYYKIVMDICRNILESGSISKTDSQLLRKVTVRRTQGWKKSNYHLSIGRVYLSENFNRTKAIRHLFLSIQKRPMNSKAWFNLILSTFPKSIIRWWKKRRYDKWKKAESSCRASD